jgi:hypothetical protein
MLVSYKLVYKLVLIYNRQTQQKNLFQKKGFPLEPRYAGMCTFSTKKIEPLTHAIWDTGLYDFVFVPETFTTPSKIQNLYESISMPYNQPISLSSQFVPK